MNTICRLPILILASLALAGCEATSKDIKQANNYRMGLPAHLGLSPGQIRVLPGAGVTYLTISDVQSPADRERIAADLQTINKNNPKLDPLKWTFQ